MGDGGYLGFLPGRRTKENKSPSSRKETSSTEGEKGPATRDGRSRGEEEAQGIRNSVGLLSKRICRLENRPKGTKEKEKNDFARALQRLGPGPQPLHALVGKEGRRKDLERTDKFLTWKGEKKKDLPTRVQNLQRGGLKTARARSVKRGWDQPRGGWEGRGSRKRPFRSFGVSAGYPGKVQGERNSGNKKREKLALICVKRKKCQRDALEP